VKRRGFDTIFQEAIDIVTKETKGFGVSLDIDGFDPSIAPGTGVKVPGGLSLDEVIAGLKKISHHPQLKALEIVEFDPSRDIDQKTVNLIQALITAIL
jgi:arginase